MLDRLLAVTDEFLLFSLFIAAVRQVGHLDLTDDTSRPQEHGNFKDGIILALFSERV